MKVIVIGAGAAGLATGWQLARAGADVVVLERGQPGRGATWAAAGMIEAPQGCESDLARRGAELWPQFAREVEEASGRAISYRRDGGLFVAMTREDIEALRAHSGEMLSAEQARAIEPRLSREMAGAMWFRDEAKVDNRALGPALAAAFVRAGGTLALNEAAVRFELRENRILGVRTPFAFRQADLYVLAAGAWSGQIQGLPAEAVPPVVPAKGEMIAFEAPEGETLPRGSIAGAGIYLVSQRGRLLVGATVERVGFDSSSTVAASKWLAERAHVLMPDLGAWKRTEHWAGLRPGSPDDLPILGPTIVEGLFVASGQFRSGILYAPAIAEAACALALGTKPPVDIAAFDPRRFRGYSASA